MDGVTTGYTAYGGGAKPNRYVDIENLASVVVSQGAAEISSASTQALGGTLAYFTDVPRESFAVLTKLTGGSFDTQRAFVRVDTGKFGGDTSRAFVSFSTQEYDSWVRDYVGGDQALSKRLHADAKSVSQLGNLKITGYAGIDNVNPEINFQGVSLQQFAQDPHRARAVGTLVHEVPDADHVVVAGDVHVGEQLLEFLAHPVDVADDDGPCHSVFSFGSGYTGRCGIGPTHPRIPPHTGHGWRRPCPRR